jgi:hypothetical protein
VEQGGSEEQGGGREPVAADFIIPLIFCGLAGYYFVNTTDMVWEAKATGIFVGAVLVVLCAVHMGRLLVLLASGRATLGFGGLFADTHFNRQRLGLLALTLLYIVTLQWVGAAFGLLLLLLAAMWIMGVRSLVQLVSIAFVTAATVYVLLIWLLSSRLPQGPVERFITALVSGG